MQYAIQERIWLHLRDAGGWWTGGEIVSTLWPQGGAPEGLIKRALRQMTGARHIKPRVQDYTELAYAVTTQCEPFDGFSLVPTDGGQDETR